MKKRKEENWHVKEVKEQCNIHTVLQDFKFCYCLNGLCLWVCLLEEVGQLTNILYILLTLDL